MHTTISQLVKEVSSYTVCYGVSNDDGRCTEHVILSKDGGNSEAGSDGEGESEHNPFTAPKTYSRHPYCQILTKGSNTCIKCTEYEKMMERANSKKGGKLMQPAKLTAPVSAIHPNQLRLALREQRLKVRQLEDKLKDMQLELQKSSFKVDDRLEEDILTIMASTGRETTPSM